MTNYTDLPLDNGTTVPLQVINPPSSVQPPNIIPKKSTIPAAQIGDYVTGKLIGQQTCRQGILIDFGKDSTLVQGQLAVYVCEPLLAVVPDSNIFSADTLVFIAKIRKTLYNIREAS
jgi:hypothetical protein